LKPNPTIKQECAKSGTTTQPEWSGK